MSNENSGTKGRRNGWRQLRLESEKGFQANFAPLRAAIKRNEFIGSIFELFVSALVGIGKIGLSADLQGQDPEKDEKTPD